MITSLKTVEKILLEYFMGASTENAALSHHDTSLP